MAVMPEACKPKSCRRRAKQSAMPEACKAKDWPKACDACHAGGMRRIKSRLPISTPLWRRMP